MREPCAAISVGIVGGLPMLDLNYSEDSTAEVDMNVVMTGSGRFIEVQGTAEGLPFTRSELDTLLELGVKGITEIVELPGGDDVVAADAPPARPTALMQFVSASANPDKVAEISAVLGPLGIELLPRPADLPDVVEDAPTLEGNARLKAVAVCEATGPAGARRRHRPRSRRARRRARVCSPRALPVRARPTPTTSASCSTRSRISLTRRNAWLGSAPSRSCGFPTVARSWPQGGSMARSRWRRAGSNGFGYDPVFEPVEADGKTFAELTTEEKNGISHRARALRTLAELLQ